MLDTRFRLRWTRLVARDQFENNLTADSFGSFDGAQDKYAQDKFLSHESSPKTYEDRKAQKISLKITLAIVG